MVGQYTRELREAFERFPFEVLSSVPETLQSLQSDPDIYLGLATGNVEEAAWAKLERASLESFFTVGGYGLDGSRRVEMTQVAWDRSLEAHSLPSGPTRGYLIGDSIYDMECARAIGVTAIGVTTGWSDAETLFQAGAHHVLDRFEGVVELLKA